MIAIVPPRVWIKAFWGFSPEEAGYLGFTLPGNRNRFLQEALPGDLVLIYGADSPDTDMADRRQALGFLQVDLKPIRDVDGMSPEHLREKIANGWQDRWTYAVPVLRAWEVKRKIEVKYLAPNTLAHHRARMVASRGDLLTTEETAQVLALPVIEKSVYGQISLDTTETREIEIGKIFSPSRGIIPVFGHRESNYEDGVHFLYLLIAMGDAGAILGRTPTQIGGKSVVKIGYSNDPTRRCAEHNAALPPASVLRWKVDFQSKAYPNGADAKAAEDMLKTLLASRFESLGGEFFLGRPEEIRSAFFSTPGVGFTIRAVPRR